MGVAAVLGSLFVGITAQKFRLRWLAFIFMGLGLSLIPTGIALISQEADSIQVRVTADSQWLESSDRKYPVTIDPTITTETNQNDVHTTFITSAMRN